MSDPFNPRHQLSLFPPRYERRADIPSGTVFAFGGRHMLVIKAFGNDAAAPVIVEELAHGPTSLKGQLGLWSAAGVTCTMTRKDKP